jgi:flagellar FliJ protein
MKQDPMQTLHALLLREREQRNRALAAHRQAGDVAQRARDQAEQLRAYREQYRARWATQFSQGGTMPIVHCYRSFMQRLDQAVAQQAQAAERCAAALALAHGELLRCERQLSSVRKLIERRGAEAQRGHQRREQKHNDEQAQRAHLNGAMRSRPMPLF